MKTLPVLALAGISSVGMGGWYKFHHLKPKTLREYLEWQGLRLLSDSEENYWKSILDENQKLVNDLSLGSDTASLKEWCRRSLESKSYDNLISNASSLCVDNPKTVKARMIQLYGSADGLISQDNDYKVAYVFRKHIEGFNSLIGYAPKVDEKGNEEEDLDAAKDAFKRWCQDSLNKPVEDTLVRNVKSLCTPKGFSSISDLINQRRETSLLLTDSQNSSKLEKKYNDIKELASWTAENKTSNGNKQDLSDWCTESKDKNFYDRGVFSEVYPKFRYRCLDGQKN